MSDENKKISLRVIRGETARSIAKEYDKSEVRVHNIVRSYCKRFFMPSEWSAIRKESWSNKRICKAVKEMMDKRDALRVK